MNPNSASEAAPNKPRNGSASRKLVVRGISLRPTEDITGASHGVDQLRQPTLFEFSPQPPDMDVDHIGLRVIMIAPNLLEQHRSGDHSPRGSHEVLKKPVLARQQLDRAAGAMYRARQQIDLEVTKLQCRLTSRNCATSYQDLEPSGQLDELEGLGEVVVTARPQASHPFVHGREGAEDEDRRFDPDRAHCRKDGKAVEVARQHPI